MMMHIRTNGTAPLARAPFGRCARSVVIPAFDAVFPTAA